MSYNTTTNNNTNTKSEAEAVAEIVRGGMAPVFNAGHGGSPVVPFVFWPREQKVISLERLLERPLRKRGVVKVNDYLSFISYVSRHKQPGTEIFMSMSESGGGFTAVLDWHVAGNGVEDAKGARWGEHVCEFKCEHSPEWKRWLGSSGDAMTQLEMAQFIEDNMMDIIEPEAARMLEVVKTLEATQGVEFKSLVRLNNGDRGLHYQHVTAAKAGQMGDIEIPEKFLLRIPVFGNGLAYGVLCRFRYRIRDGALTLSYEVVRPHKVVETALVDARTAITEKLAVVPVMLGSAVVGKAEFLLG